MTVMKAYRAAILRFADDESAIYEKDGLLVVGPDANGRQVVRAVGDYATLAPELPGRRRGAPARPHHRAGLHRHAHPLPADGRDRLARGGPAALAGGLHLPARVALFRRGACAGTGHLLPRRVAAARRHHAAGFRHLASVFGERAHGRGAAARPAADRGQGAAGQAFARRRARRDRAIAGRQRDADPAMARQGPAGLCHHAALRAQLQRGAAARRRRTGGEVPGRVDPVPRGREPGRGEVGARAVPAVAQLPGHLRRLRPDARACHLRPLHPPGR